MNTGVVSSCQLHGVAEQLKAKKGVLYFQGRIVVPKRARDSVLRKVHSAGHFGQRRALQNLRRSYFWLGMARDGRTRTVCRGCLVCQKAKPSNHAKVSLQDFRIDGVGPGDLGPY